MQQRVVPGTGSVRRLQSVVLVGVQVRLKRGWGMAEEICIWLLLLM